MSFLTVEDVNTIFYKFQQFFWWNIDTNKISDDADFTDIEYDMCKVTKETLSNSFKYTFNIRISRWTNGFYVLDKNNEFQNVSYSFNNNKLIITTPKTNNFKSINVFLYCGVTAFNNVTSMNYKLINDEISLNYKELNTPQTINYKILSTDSLDHKNFNLDKNYNLLKDNSNNFIGYLKVNLIKSDLKFNCNQILKVGMENTILLGVSDDYKPNGDMIGNNTPVIYAVYEDNIIPVVWDETLNDYVFNLDLSDKTEEGKIRFKVIVESNVVVNKSETNVILNSNYKTVTNFIDFVDACSNSDIIRLGADILANSDIEIEHSTKIIGNNHVIDLNNHSIILNEDIDLDIEKIIFRNGDSAIKQSKNSQLKLTECSFTNCISTEYNNFGSCILCKTDYDSLSADDDFITILNDCIFINNHSAILHGGQLTVDNCKFHNTNISMFNKNNPAFIYQIDGDAIITNTTFDIDYTSDILCSDLKNIGYGQCVFLCGETATINNVSYEQLKNNNNLSFFETGINNRSHVFAKYYYPHLETCVYISPSLGNEDKALNYAVSGDDKIYKFNTQITRVSDGIENNIRKIVWED